MKSIFLFLSMVCFTLISFGQTTNAYYDDTLARKLYADEYGFKNMVRLLYLNTSKPPIKYGNASHNKK